MEYTKGDWRVTMGKCHVVVLRDGCVYDIAYCEDKDMPVEERRANAQLIASAPDMYEALKSFDRYLTAPYPDNLKYKKHAVEQMELALKKAEGK